MSKGWWYQSHGDFNPHTLCRVWHFAWDIRGVDQHFNPHTLCRVWHIFPDQVLILERISIHTPFAGCDTAPEAPYWDTVDFNPHTLCRVWHTRGFTAKDNEDFNPHTLCRVWLWRNQRDERKTNFNPHTLCRVWRYIGCFWIYNREFQSTHPLQGVTSEHKAVPVLQFQFQSTHPLQGVT